MYAYSTPSCLRALDREREGEKEILPTEARASLDFETTGSQLSVHCTRSFAYVKSALEYCILVVIERKTHAISTDYLLNARKMEMEIRFLLCQVLYLVYRVFVTISYDMEIRRDV